MRDGLMQLFYELSTYYFLPMRAKKSNFELKGRGQKAVL